MRRSLSTFLSSISSVFVTALVALAATYGVYPPSTIQRRQPRRHSSILTTNSIAPTPSRVDDYLAAQLPQQIDYDYEAPDVIVANIIGGGDLLETAGHVYAYAPPDTEKITAVSPAFSGGHTGMTFFGAFGDALHAGVRRLSTFRWRDVDTPQYMPAAA